MAATGKAYGHPHPNYSDHVSLDREGPEENGEFFELLPGYCAPFVDDRIRKEKKVTVSLSYRFDCGKAALEPI